MSRINSKNKGNRFERAICKWFQSWTGYEFSRVPASGGLRWKKTDNITSDITCTDPDHARDFLFSVECKSYQDIKFEHVLLGNKNCKISQFWEQTTRDAKRGDKIPLLVMKYNNMPKGEAFFVVDYDLGSLILGLMKSPKVMCIYNGKGLFLSIFLLSEIKSLNYKNLCNLIRKQLK